MAWTRHLIPVWSYQLSLKSLLPCLESLLPWRRSASRIEIVVLINCIYIHIWLLVCCVGLVLLHFVIFITLMKICITDRNSSFNLLYLYTYLASRLLCGVGSSSLCYPKMSDPATITLTYIFAFISLRNYSVQGFCYCYVATSILYWKPCHKQRNRTSLIVWQVWNLQIPQIIGQRETEVPPSVCRDWAPSLRMFSQIAARLCKKFDWGKRL